EAGQAQPGRAGARPGRNVVRPATETVNGLDTTFRPRCAKTRARSLERRGPAANDCRARDLRRTPTTDRQSARHARCPLSALRTATPIGRQSAAAGATHLAVRLGFQHVLLCALRDRGLRLR